MIGTVLLDQYRARGDGVGFWMRVLLAGWVACSAVEIRVRVPRGSLLTSVVRVSFTYTDFTSYRSGRCCRVESGWIIHTYFTYVGL